jgi:hypothetical protein
LAFQRRKHEEALSLDMPVGDPDWPALEQP